MTVVGVCSLHGSPGATTTALAVASRLQADHGGAVLVEADPTGGVLAARLDLGLSPNLVDAAAAARHALAPHDLERFLQPVNGGPEVLVAHPSATQTSAALRAGGAALAAVVAARTDHVVVDLGRWCPDAASHLLVPPCVRVLVVVRPVLDQIVQLLHLADASLPVERLGVVVIGRHRYSARQIGEVSGLNVAAELPDDPAAVCADPCAAATRTRAHWAARIRELARWCA